MTYNFPDHISGDTFLGVEFTVSNASGAVDLTGAIMCSKLKNKDILKMRNYV